MTKTKSKGVGDTIEKVTKATGIKKVVDKISEVFDIDCGCEKRKEILNKMFPYQVECLTEDEYKYLSNFSFRNTSLTHEQRKDLLVIYNRVFNRKQKMTNCSKCWVRVVNELRAVYTEYEKDIKKLK